MNLVGQTLLSISTMGTTVELETLSGKVVLLITNGSLEALEDNIIRFPAAVLRIQFSKLSINLPRMKIITHRGNVLIDYIEQKRKEATIEMVMEKKHEN